VFGIVKGPDRIDDKYVAAKRRYGLRHAKIEATVFVDWLAPLRSFQVANPADAGMLSPINV
jgi:hypothetical protein